MRVWAWKLASLSFSISSRTSMHLAKRIFSGQRKDDNECSIFFIIAFKYVCALIYLSSSGMWMAIMETGSSLSKDHPRMSESLRAWFTRLRFGTLAHVFGFMHCTYNKESGIFNKRYVFCSGYQKVPFRLWYWQSYDAQFSPISQ